MDSLEFPRLSSPQLVAIAGACAKAKIVYNIDSLVSAIEGRLEAGGSLAPTKIISLIGSLSALQATKISTLVDTLLQSFSPNLPAVLAANLVSELGRCSVGNPDILKISANRIDDLLVLLADPNMMQEVMEDERLASRYKAALSLLGESGAISLRHLQSIDSTPRVLIERGAKFPSSLGEPTLDSI